jgi:hypothetical protein
LKIAKSKRKVPIVNLKIYAKNNLNAFNGDDIVKMQE